MESVQREEVKEYIFRDGLESGRLVDLIKAMQEILNKVPGEYRDKVEFEIHVYVDYGEPIHTFRAWYMRPETDAEYKSRIAREMNRYEAEAQRLGSQAHLAEGLHDFYKAERARLEKELRWAQ